jgi:ABC-type sugar transport system permease subunit
VIRNRRSLFNRETFWSYLFLAPWILGFLMFTAVPMAASVGFSFTNYNLISQEETKFVGLENYQWLLENREVRNSAKVTLSFALMVVPLSILTPLLLAAVLTSKWVYGKPIFRTLFFMPTIVPLVAGVIIWNGYLNSTTGWLNRFLAEFGIDGPVWLNDRTYIYPALVMIAMWSIGNAMTTLIAGMQGVPTELYEAGKVDGANGFVLFRRITVPFITPVIFYNLILSVIGAGQYFLVPLVLKGPNGDPAGATNFFNLYLFRTAFNFSQMGRGAAMAWVLFIVALAITGILFGTSKYWVYYSGGEAK